MRARVRGAAGINFTDADARAAPTSRVHLNGHSRRGGITLIAGDGGSPFISRIVALDLGRSMKNNDASAARGLSPRQAENDRRPVLNFTKAHPLPCRCEDHAQNFLFLFRRASRIRSSRDDCICSRRSAARCVRIRAQANSINCAESDVRRALYRTSPSRPLM